MCALRCAARRLAHDRLVCKNADEMRRWGFTTQQWNAAAYLQRLFRGRNARVYFNKMRYAINIMQDAEMLYLNNPTNVPYKVRFLSHGSSCGCARS